MEEKEQRMNQDTTEQKEQRIERERVTNTRVHLFIPSHVSAIIYLLTHSGIPQDRDCKNEMTVNEVKMEDNFISHEVRF